MNDDMRENEQGSTTYHSLIAHCCIIPFNIYVALWNTLNTSKVSFARVYLIFSKTKYPSICEGLFNYEIKCCKHFNLRDPKSL